MYQYENTGQYSANSKPPQEAEFELKKNKLQIKLQDAFNNTKLVYWYYDKILKEKSAEKTFKHSDFPPQYIIVRSSKFEEDLENRITKSKKAWITRQGALLWKILFSFLALILLFYFFGIPWLATVVAKRFPVSYEKSIGDQVFNSMKKDFVIDEKKTAYINDFFDQMKIPSAYDIRITVVKSDVTNAFALPGGNIVVYDKILAGMTSYHELAALLSHEFTHVQNKHSLRSLIRQLGATIFLSLIIGDVNAIGAIIISNADNLKGMSYSRSLEKEADQNGLQILKERGMDCNGFVRLFQLLKKEDTVKVSEWVSSHPDLNKRIKYIQNSEDCKQNNVLNSATLHTLFTKLKTE